MEWGRSHLATRIDETLCSLATLPSTLLHSDLRTDNLLFTADGGEVALVDWQGAGSGPPSWDLAYFLSQALDVDTRREHESDLLDLYVSEVARMGIDQKRDELLRGYGEAMLFGLVVAASLPLIADPDQPRVQSSIGHGDGSTCSGRAPRPRRTCVDEMKRRRWTHMENR